MYTYKSDRGQALVVIALAAVGLISIVALVVDGGKAFADRRKAQNAADSAALAAALARIRGGQSMTSTALESAAQNGYNNDGLTNVIELYSPPKDGAHAGDIEYIQVIITSHVNTYFARIIGRDKITNTVQAIARTKSAEITQLLHGTAIISLAPTSNCATRKSFWVHGEATLDITGGGIFVNSNNPSCALITQGSGSIRIRDGFSIDVVGEGASVQKPHLVTPAVTVGAGPIGYPPPFFMPKVGCPDLAQISEDGTSMSAGSWGDDFPPEGVTRLESGVYCLDDGMKITGDLEGHNVVFKVLGGEVRFGTGTILLDAPNSGDHAGLLLYLPMDNNSKVVLNGGPASTIKGTILAPASPILIKGNSSPRGFHSQIIGYTIEADGNSNVVIVYNDEQNYDSLTMPEVQLSE